MKLEKKKMTITVYYYECGVPGHRHKNKRVAEGCVERQKKKTGKKQSEIMAEAKERRWSMLFDLLCSADTIKEVAKKHGVSSTCVTSNCYKLIRKARRLLKIELEDYLPRAPKWPFPEDQFLNFRLELETAMSKEKTLGEE